MALFQTVCAAETTSAANAENFKLSWSFKVIKTEKCLAKMTSHESLDKNVFSEIPTSSSPQYLWSKRNCKRDKSSWKMEPQIFRREPSFTLGGKIPTFEHHFWHKSNCARKAHYYGFSNEKLHRAATYSRNPFQSPIPLDWNVLKENFSF